MRRPDTRTNMNGSPELHFTWLDISIKIILVIKFQRNLRISSSFFQSFVIVKFLVNILF
jgi:hypothetical protein